MPSPCLWPPWNLQWTRRMDELLPWCFFNVRVMSWSSICWLAVVQPSCRCRGVPFPFLVLPPCATCSVWLQHIWSPKSLPKTGWCWAKNPVVHSVLSVPSWIQKHFAAQKILRVHLEMTEHTLETSWVTKLSSTRHNYFSPFSREAARQAKFWPSSSSFSSSRWSHGSGSLSKILRAKTCSDLSCSRGNLEVEKVSFCQVEVNAASLQTFVIFLQTFSKSTINHLQGNNQMRPDESNCRNLARGQVAVSTHGTLSGKTCPTPNW